MLLIISYAVCILYVTLISVFIIGWNRAKVFHNEESNSDDLLVSLIIPVRNEADNIVRLLQALEKQTYANLEIVLVNDHSTDNTLDIISDYIAKKDNILLVDAIGQGKKNALKEGIDNSTGQLIVCTDGDCIPQPQWIETIVNFYVENESDMIIAPVVMAYNTGFQQMQALEFLSLQASTAGAACAGFPIMCNGANLAFTRETWNINNDNLRNEKLSGDDMFLMMSIKKRNGKISYLKSDKAVVFTKPCNSLSEFFNQRKRWVSKSPAYYDKDVILSALIVLAISVIIILNLVFVVFVDTSYWIPLAFIFLVKIIADRILLFSFGKFVRSTQLLRWILPLSIIYPFYVLYTTISGLFGSFSWKGRKSLRA